MDGKIVPTLNTLHFPGPPDAVPLVIAHGLFGSARNWTAVARRLSQERLVLVCDMRNHGDSFHHPDHSYPALADDLAQVTAGLGQPAHVLGHSMGGKAAMVAALRHPGVVRSLIVADIAPVGYLHTHAGTVSALQGVDLTSLTRRSDADTRLSPEITDPFLRSFLLQSLSFEPQGARWKLNLAALAAAMQEIAGFPEFSVQFPGPSLFLRGTDSAYVLPGHHAAIRRLFPAAEIEALQGAGHWLHADQPQEFCARVSRFLAGKD